jgi:hypothetical protein
MTDPNKAFKRMKYPADKDVRICCMECGETRFVKNSVWWDESIDIECECGNLWDWRLAD